MSDLLKTITEAIEANLPEQIGSQLKKRLEEAETDRKDNEKLRKKVDGL